MQSFKENSNSGFNPFAGPAFEGMGLAGRGEQPAEQQAVGEPEKTRPGFDQVLEDMTRELDLGELSDKQLEALALEILEAEAAEAAAASKAAETSDEAEVVSAEAAEAAGEICESEQLTSGLDEAGEPSDEAEEISAEAGEIGELLDGAERQSALPAVSGRMSHKSITIQGRLPARPAAAGEQGRDPLWKMTQQPSRGLRQPLRRMIRLVSGSSLRRPTAAGLKRLRRIGALAALFAVVLSSGLYYGHLIRNGATPGPGTVSYLTSDASVQRTSADSGAVLIGGSELRQVFLTGSSVEEDLNLVVTDITGQQVSGAAFVFDITGPDGQQFTATDEDMDGEVTVEQLSEGDYLVEMQPIDGFVVPEATLVSVVGRIEYVKIEDIGDLIVDQDEVNSAEEDSQYGGGNRPEETTPPVSSGDTVEFVESRVETVDETRTETVTRFKGKIDAASGRLYYADGSLSDVIPVLDSQGYLTGEYTIFKQTYSVTVQAGTGGSASADRSSAEAFSEVKLTATPAQGYVFSGWSASSSSAEFKDPAAASTVMYMPAESVTVTASFSPAAPSVTEYSITVQSGTGGSASAQVAKAAAGSQVSITAVPSGGYVFSGWSATAGSFTDQMGASTTFTMPAANVTITASFAPDTTGGAMGGDINLFATDQSGKYIYALTPETVTQTYTEQVTKYYGWQDLDGKTYYFDKNGNKVTGAQIIKGVAYVFGTDGALAESEAVLGIDVSTWQGSIDWNAVKASGVEFVIIRCGFRGYGTGKIVEDNRYRENIQGAKAAGLRVGVYFYSQAINTTEAVEEASAVLELVKGYSLDYPIIIDMEDAGAASARTNGLTRSELTKITVAFCETVKNSGYSAMVYANKYWLESKLDTSQFGGYYIWLAHYTGGSVSSYKGRYEMWQYTSVGRVNGISGNVDMNYSYMG